MELTIGEHAGFCFGVRRAVLKAFECAEKQLPCVTLGPLIHNPQEVERLRRAGIRSVETLDEVKPGETVMIRSHGVTPDVYRQCEARGIPVIDATCPHVAHIHQLVRQYSEHGDAVVIVGEADHPEVVGIAGWARGRVFILPDAQAAEQAELPQKALVVAQTTIRRDRFDSVLQVLRRRVPDLTERITICAATSQRQQEAERRYYGNMKPAAGGAKKPGQQGAHPQEGPHPQREPFAQKESAHQKSSPAQEAV